MKNSMKVLVLGSRGQLGTALCGLFKKRGMQYIGLDLPKFDITSGKKCEKQINEICPNIIINCSAFTDVKKAEYERDMAFNINALSLQNIVSICNKHNIWLIHISTDYVFNGKSKIPYKEDDLPDPINYYGLTKYFSEKLIGLYSNKYTIIRTSTLYGDSLINSENVVKKIIKFAQKNQKIMLVKDEYISPTYSKNLAEQILLIIENKTTGIIHATSEGYCNWVEFGKYIFELININVEIEEVKSSYFNKSLKKPKFSVLENNVLKENNINIMPDWKGSLNFFLAKQIYWSRKQKAENGKRRREEEERH